MDLLAALRALSVLLAFWMLSGWLKLFGVLEERLCINLWTVIWIEDYGPQLRTDLIHCENESHNFFFLSLCFTMLQLTLLPCYKHYNWHCFTILQALQLTLCFTMLQALQLTLFYHSTCTTVDTCGFSHFHTIFIYICVVLGIGSWKNQFEKMLNVCKWKCPMPTPLFNTKRLKVGVLKAAMASSDPVAEYFMFNTFTAMMSSFKIDQ